MDCVLYELLRFFFDLEALENNLSFVFAMVSTHRAVTIFKRDIPPCCLVYTPLKELESLRLVMSFI